MDVLANMVVTATVLHLERSALNKSASENTVKEGQYVVEPIQKRRRKNKEKDVGEKTKVNETEEPKN